MAKYKIEKNIPFPDEIGKVKDIVDAAKVAKVGESFLVSDAGASARVAAVCRARLLGYIVRSRKVATGGFRVWRVK